MDIIIAPDSFKGSLSSYDVACAIAKGIKRGYPLSKTTIVPVADGGEGTVEAIIRATQGEIIETHSIDPLGEVCASFWGKLPDGTAIIEMAATSGLTLVPRDLRNPLNTTTYGTGQLIAEALDKGAKKIIIGVGGSATNDGGVGMAQALGVSFKDKNGDEIELNGGAVGSIASIDMSNLNPKIKEAEILIANDVTNPLLGKTGATAVYSRQKGANQERAKKLEKNLTILADITAQTIGQDFRDEPGAGAAGGLAFGLMSFLGAKLSLGIDTILDAINFDELLEKADLVITGEGQIDGQSLYGKVPVGIAKRAKNKNVPVIALVGSIGKGGYLANEHNINAVFSITNAPIGMEEAIRGTADLLEKQAEQLIRFYQAGRE